MDGEERVQEALNIWDGQEGKTPAEPATPAAEATPVAADPAAPAEPKKEEAAKPGEPAKPAEAAKPEVAAPGDAPKTPETQELEGYRQILKDSNIQTADELRLTVQDAGMLYEVLDGKRPPRDLLEAVKRVHSPEVYQSLMADLRAYVREQDGAPKPPEAPAGAPQAAGPAQPPTQPSADQQRIHEQRLSHVQNFEKHIKGLGEKNGLTADDVPGYMDWISRRIGQDPKMLAAFESGKMNDVERLFTEYHNQKLAQFERWNKSLLEKRTTAQNTAPKVPGGGAPPAPTEPTKMPPAKGSDERIARARAAWDGQTQ